LVDKNQRPLFCFEQKTKQKNVNTKFLNTKLISWTFFKQNYFTPKNVQFESFGNIYMIYSRLQNRQGPQFIDLIFFPGTMVSLKALSTFINLFKKNQARCLFVLPNFPGPTFYPCPTSIPESKIFGVM
jgi:hypothetical protein